MLRMLEVIAGILIALIAAVILCAFSWYRIVPASEAHVIVTSKGTFIAASDKTIQSAVTNSYFAVPSMVPLIGTVVRRMDLTIKELLQEQETIEKNQARFKVKSSLKYRIKDVQKAAETFSSEEDVKEQLKEVVNAAVRAVTVNYDVSEARSKKQEIADKVNTEIADDLAKWGLELTSFQLVDFQDTATSTVISDISKRSEVQIQTRTREENAEKLRSAREKEAQAEELARKREIERDKVIAEQEQLKIQKIAEQTKISEEKRYEVIKVQEVKQAEIEKAKALVQAEQEKEVAEINKDQAIIKATQDKETQVIIKEQQRLQGEGYRLQKEEEAKGNAADIRERGIAEADAKDRLQKALNEFKPAAIQALVAEKIVAAQQAIGVATANALSTAKVRIFAGGDSSKQGFDLGAMVEASKVSNDSTSKAILNKIARPNDLGLSQLELEPTNTKGTKSK